jgi:Fe-S cluster assembly protein SufD
VHPPFRGPVGPPGHHRRLARPRVRWSPTLTALTPDAAAGLDGPDWLRARRRAAAERFAASGLPSPAEEVWRYSRVDEIDPDRLVPAEPGGDGPAGHRIGDPCSVTIVDGRLRSVEGALTGVEIGPLAEAKAGEQALGAVLGDAPDAFAELNTAFSPEPVLVRVAPGTVVDHPVVVHVHAAAPGALSVPRLVVEVGADAQVTVVELQTSSPRVGLVSAVTEIGVGAAARARHVTVQDLDPATWQIATQVSRVEQSADFLAAGAALGGDYARLRTDCRLAGRGATGTLLAAYLGRGDQMLDFRTFQDHAAPDTTSELLFKGVLDDRSRSVYTGLIRVRPDARGTDAFQTNRNLKLSEHAWAESVPNLEIENNDVRCSHASTVGPVDEGQRFYLESRGVPTEVAERLIVAGFFDEVLARFPVDDVAASVRDEIGATLGTAA